MRRAWAIGAGLAIAGLLALLAVNWSLIDRSSDVGIERAEAVRTVGEIRYLDEALTMSARLAVSADAPRFERRYRKLVPRLNEALADAFAGAASERTRELIGRTTDANARLVALERRAFELRDAGRGQAARELLLGPRYGELKRAYSSSLAAALERIVEVAPGPTELNRLEVGVVATTGLSMAVILAGLLYSRRATRRWTREREVLHAEQGRVLRQNELILRSVGEGIVGLDRGGRISFVNPAAEELLELSQQELLGRDVHDVIGLDRRASRLTMLLAEGERANGDYLLPRPDGEGIPVEWRGEPICEEGEVRGAVLSFSDVSGRDRAERELRASEERLRALVRDAPLVMFAVDRDGVFTSSEGGGLRLLGLAPNEVVGTSLFDFYPDHPEIHATFERALDGQELTSSYEVEGHVWETRWIPIRGAGGGVESVMGIASDAAARRELDFFPYHDELTDLLSGAGLDHRIEHAVERAARDGRKVALLALDLDHFGLVNGSFGQEVGDQLLRGVAGRLRGSVREGDTLARRDGDEFVVLLENLRDDAEAACAARAQQLIRTVREPVTVEDAELRLDATVGIVLYPDHAADGKELTRRVELAVAEAKVADRGGFRFYAGGDSQPRRQLDLLGDLRGALDGDQLSLSYQPIFRLADGALVGAEALLRWEHPELGAISPGEFIPLAEGSGLIHPLGDWVVSACCRQARTWRDEGLELKLSFNVSPQQLSRPELAGTLRRELGANGLDGSELTVEITESSIVADAEVAHGSLRAIQAMGIDLAIDDFGTGYSSLARLSRLPSASLKIDRSFVDTLPDQSEGRAIVEGIASLGSGLGMSTVAEGIETEAQLDYLAAQGIDYGQGFLLGRPGPAAAVAAAAARAHPQPVGAAQ